MHGSSRDFPRMHNLPSSETDLIMGYFQNLSAMKVSRHVVESASRYRFPPVLFKPE